jgi:hypothetical protein
VELLKPIDFPRCCARGRARSAERAMAALLFAGEESFTPQKEVAFAAGGR